jgi:hypothetical protein
MVMLKRSNILNSDTVIPSLSQFLVLNYEPEAVRLLSHICLYFLRVITYVKHNIEM